jgi:HSP20 family protein
MPSIVRFREPFRTVAGVNGEFERLVNALFEAPARAATSTNQAWAPPLDVWETETEIVYAFDLPGLSEDRVSVDLDAGSLTVCGVRERPERIEEDRYFRFERRFGEFTRSVALPEGAADGDVAANYVDGVLEVRVRKPEHTKPRRIPVMKTVENGARSSGVSDDSPTS